MNKFLATAATLLALATPAFATDDDCEINLDQYNKVKIGMRLSEVVEAFGCDGSLSYSGKGGSYKFENYSWEGAVITLMNGSVHSKTHHGLRPAGVPKPVQKGIVINIDINHDTGKVTVEPPTMKTNPTDVGQKAIDAMPK